MLISFLLCWITNRPCFLYFFQLTKENPRPQNLLVVSQHCLREPLSRNWHEEAQATPSRDKRRVRVGRWQCRETALYQGSTPSGRSFMKADILNMAA